jgi:acyl-CoA thioesterase-1
MYPAPTVVGGTAPVTTSCTQPSGSAFAVGRSEVACTVRDARGRTASCGFAVTVTLAPRLSATRFLAFGDSITLGVTSECIRAASTGPAGVLARGRFAFLFRLVPPGSEYPGALQTLLRNRYVGQTPGVVNAGVAGETTSEGVLRLPRTLTEHAPEALLLQEGVNDVNELGGDAVPVVEDNLRSMIREARGRGMQVFVGTLLPQQDGGCRAYDLADGRVDLVPANVEIRTLAASEGAVLVDLYQSFVGQEATLIGEDGLHPTVTGYSRIAEAFFEAIRTTLERP